MVWFFLSILEDQWSMHFIGAKLKVCLFMKYCSHISYIVAKAAPDWNGTAVVGDPPSFKDLKLVDFKGYIVV